MSDLVLEDVCEIVGHTQKFPPHERKFMRNVFTESVGDLGQCVDGAEAYPLRGEECIVLTVLESSNSNADGSSSGASNAKQSFGAAAMGVAAAIVGAVL